MNQTVEMKCTIDKDLLIKGIAKALEIDFLTPESTPDDPMKAVVTCGHIFESVGDCLKELSDDHRRCALLARELGFEKYMDQEKLVRDIAKDLDKNNDMPELLKDLLRALLKHSGKKHES